MTVKMSATFVCIQLNRTLIILLTCTFIILTIVQMLHFNIIRWPEYPMVVCVILDLVLLVGLIASLSQHLKSLIFFSWLIALTCLLIFFGNTVSTNYQSDLLGMLYLLLICVLAFTDAVCIIKYRMPCEEAHHPFIKCSQQQLYEQAESLPIPPPPHHLSSSSSSHQLHTQPSQQHHPHPHPHPHLHHLSHHPHLSQVQPASIISSPSSPLPPPPPLNNHCYAPKNDPQFHAV